MTKCILLFVVVLVVNLPLSAQCPDRGYLWHRIIFLRDSSNVSASEQLTELRGYHDKIRDCPYYNDSTQSLLLLRIGWLFSQQNDLKNAILFTIRSINVIHDHAGNKNINEAHLIKCYYNLQILYDSANQAKLRIRALDSCISLSIKLKTGYNYALKAIADKIEYYFGKGDYYKCIDYSITGEQIIRNSQYHLQEIDFYIIWRINSLVYLHEYDAAARIAKKSMEDCILKSNTTYVGSYLLLLSYISAEKRDSADAIRYSKESIVYNLKYRNYENCAATYNNLALYLYFQKLNDQEKALHYFTLALKYANDNFSIEILNNIANLYVKKSDFKNAQAFYEKAFDKMYPGIKINDVLKKSAEDILSHSDIQYVIKLVLDLADANLEFYKQTKNISYLLSAVNIFRSADKMMDRIKISQTELYSKLFWRIDTRRLYDHATESSFLLGDHEQVFYFMEKSRASLLIDQLKEEATGDSSMVELSIVKKKILNQEREMASLKSDSKEYAEMQRSLFLLKEQSAHIDQMIKEHNPWYYQSLLDTNFVELRDIQKKLSEKNDPKTILEFFHGDSATYVLSISSDKSRITRINKNAYEKLVDLYMYYLSDPTKENQNYEGFINCSRDLYQLIFSRIELPKGRIIISPDGKYYPFEALVTNSNLSTPDYFLKKHIVSYTYSVRYLLNDFTKNRSKSDGNFLGVAPVTYPQSFQLSALPVSDISLNIISSYFTNTHSLIASQATRNNFMHQFQDYKIIQLYTHASDTSAYGEPVIYFSDSALYLSELIPEGKIATRLVVLSACETGNGKLYKGEGVFSFNRGFASLGIPSSVINLWSVDDESTYRLTELFYKYVNEGLALDQALQKAKLEFISSSSREKRLPYYWAAAVLVGKSDKIEMHNGMGWRYVYIASGILFLIYLAWKLIQKNFGKVPAKQ
jgi:CHAT domain-containing protein